MKLICHTFATLLFAAAPVLAQGNFDKTYPVSTHPALQLESDNASIKLSTCGDCRRIHVHVDPRGADLSEWTVRESQSGSGVHFSLQQRSNEHWFGQVHSPEIDVEMPSEGDLTARSGNGSVTLDGVHGNVEVSTGNGAIVASSLRGMLTLHTGEGAVTLRGGEGTLHASTGNGAIELGGRFARFDAHSGNGSIHMQLESGSVLQGDSSVSTGNGSIALTLPRTLRANVEADSGMGRVSSQLPGVNAEGSPIRNKAHGSMNGGGGTLRVHSGNGSITLSAQ